MARRFSLEGGRKDPGGGGSARWRPSRLWRLVLPLAGATLLVAGWAVFPVVRFSILRGRYESSEGDEREVALRALLRLRSPLAIPVLLGEFRDPDRREEYLEYLLELLEERDLEFLIGRVKSGAREGRSTAAFAIAAIIDRPWARESPVVQDALPEIYGALLDGLTGGAAAVDYIHKMRSLLHHRPGSEAVGPILERLRGAEPLDQVNAIRAVYHLRDEPLILGDARILPLIREAMDSETETVRLAAVLVLEDQASPEDSGILLRATRDPDFRIRKVACSVLGGMGGEGVADALVARLEDDADTVRRAAALSLGRLRVEGIVPDLLRMLRDVPMTQVIQGGVTVRIPNPFPAEAAAAALAHFPTKEVAAALGRVARDKDSHRRVRLRAIRSLGEAGEAGAIPDLAAVLENREWILRLEAISALQEIQGREAVVALLYRLREVVRSDPTPGEIEALGGALRRITGEEFGPYPGDDRSEGEAGIRLWEEWLEVDGEGQ